MQTTQCHGQRYLFLHFSRWTEWLSRDLLLLKIGYSVHSAKLCKLPSFRKRPFYGCSNTSSKIVFYLVIRSSLLLRFYKPAFLQSACLLAADYSEELCSHRPTFQFESAHQTCLRISENIWKCLKVFERLWSYLKAKQTLLCLRCPCCCCSIELDEPSTRSWQESANRQIRQK